MASDITLSSAQRKTLISLKNSSQLSDRTQVRLATGNKINDVTDGAEGYFTARSLDIRAEVFDNRFENIDQGISTIQTSLEGIDALDELLGQFRGLARQARSQTAFERGQTTRSFEILLEQFKLLLDDATYQGLNLLDNAQARLTVEFSDKGESDINIPGTNILATTGITNGAIFDGGVITGHIGGVAGLERSNILHIVEGFSTLTTGFFSTLTIPTGGLTRGFSVLSNATNLESLDRLDETLANAQSNLQVRANTLGANVAILQTRLDFTDGLVNHLVSGADKITNADLNEEAANLTATGTRYQIGVQALGTAAQRLQSLLQVIR